MIKQSRRDADSTAGVKRGKSFVPIICLFSFVNFRFYNLTEINVWASLNANDGVSFHRQDASI